MKMKLLVLALGIMSIQITQVLAQENPSITITSWAHGGNGKNCDSSSVEVIFRIVDLMDGDKVVYQETQTTMTNEYGQFAVNIGEGDVLSGEFNIEFIKNNARYKIRADMIIDCNGEEVIIFDQPITTPTIPIAEDAKSWGGMPAPDMKSDTIGWKEILGGLFGWNLPVFASDSMGKDSTKLMTPTDLRAQITQKDLCDFLMLDPMTPDEIQDKVDNNSGAKEIMVDLFGNTSIIGGNSLIPVEYFPGRLQRNWCMETIQPVARSGHTWSVFNLCGITADPWNVFGDVRENEDPLSKMSHLISKSEMGTLANGYEVSINYKQKAPEPNRFPEHNTAAIWGNNPSGTTGIFGSGGFFGSFSQGATGTFGVTLNDGLSGTGVWGTIGQQPAKGLFAYGVLADANNFLSSTQAWAVAIFGDGFHTGTLSQMSDARLKHSMRAPSQVLGRIMKLEPTKYQYNQSTSLNLPEGEHYGFIAQEMEEVFPELVSEVVVPAELEEDSMSTGDTEQYKAINYNELIPILTKAIQELNIKVDAQNAEIKRLATTIENLKK